MDNACRAPLDWETPTGKSAKVNLALQLSAFFGYGKNDSDSYLGLQAHGVLWAADPTQTPVNWPIAPPIVAGKVTPSCKMTVRISSPMAGLMKMLVGRWCAVGCSTHADPCHLAHCPSHHCWEGDPHARWQSGDHLQWQA